MLPYQHQRLTLLCCADVYNAVSLLALIFALYAALYLAIGPVFLPPGGAAWAIVFVWFTALLLGMIVDRVRQNTSARLFLSCFQKSHDRHVPGQQNDRLGVFTTVPHSSDLQPESLLGA